MIILISESCDNSPSLLDDDLNSDQEAAKHQKEHSFWYKNIAFWVHWSDLKKNLQGTLAKKIQ